MTAGAPLPRVLLVDDEPNVLDALRRQLRREFAVETAVGAANGLAMLGRFGPFAVVVSDFLMPGISGADFLAMARKAAPLTTRMLLTGQADLGDAASTVNQGQVFRMLLKPVDHDTMVGALRDCVEHHRLLVAERELLEQTLNGSVKALTDVLSLASPTGFGRATRMRRLASALLDHIDAEDRWAIELAAMMSQLGVVTLPPHVSEKLDAGADLDSAERAMIEAVPDVSEQLLSSIPRMAPVCEAIRYSRNRFDGSGMPVDYVSGNRIPLGGRLLRIVQDHDELTARGITATEAYAALEVRTGHYDPQLLRVLAVIASEADATLVERVSLAGLTPGMVLAANACTKSGAVLVTRGQEVTVSMLARLRNFATLEDPVAEPLLVRVAEVRDPEPESPHGGD